MKHRDYINSEGWKILRNQAIDKSGGLCEFCGEGADEVHHVRYPKSFDKDSLDNLVVTCRKCHETSHGIKQEQIMENNLQVNVFSADGNDYAIRQEDKNGITYYRLHDIVCALSDSSEQIQKSMMNMDRIEYHLDDDEYGRFPYKSKIELWVTREGGYGVAMALHTPRAKSFKRWLKHVAIPAQIHGNMPQVQTSNSVLQHLQSTLAVLIEHENKLAQLPEIKESADKAFEIAVETQNKMMDLTDEKYIAASEFIRDADITDAEIGRAAARLARETGATKTDKGWHIPGGERLSVRVPVAGSIYGYVNRWLKTYLVTVVDKIRAGKLSVGDF